MAVCQQDKDRKLNSISDVKRGNRFKDETGNKYGLLTVLSLSHYDEKRRIYFWNCKCSCGKLTVKNAGTLRSGATKSCGCLKVEINIGNKKRETHGFSYTRLYRVWSAMKSRCYRKKDVGYAWYGGKGIIVCDEWKNSFDVFKYWALQNGYNDNMTIDRIDSNGNYEPNNCQFLTRAENSKKVIHGTKNKTSPEKEKVCVI